MFPRFQNSREVSVDETFPQFDAQNLVVLHGEIVTFPELPYYGFDHGDKTAKLALVILGEDATPAENTARAQRAIWCAGLFHDLGRRAPLGTPDPDHAQRSATLAEAILRGHHDLWADEDLRETVCRLIAHHGTRPAGDPLARALWDADHYEACRVAPGTREGLEYLKRQTQADTLCTAWARDKTHLQRYMQFRGWR